MEEMGLEILKKKMHAWTKMTVTSALLIKPLSDFVGKSGNVRLNTENGGSTFLQNVGILQPDYTTTHPRN
jgi:hypothetical protein